MHPNQVPAPHNPFATRWTRPGAIPFHFPDDIGVSDLIGQLRSEGWWGQIVGSHGTGKSTLLATLLPALQQAQRKPVFVTLHDGQRRLPRSAIPPPPWSADLQWIVDGYEQLSHLNRFRFKQRCRQSGCGLLVTSHGSVGLPHLIHVRTSLETVSQIVALRTRDESAVDPEVIAASYSARRGNVREVLFDLYDLYEQNSRTLRKYN